MSIDQSPLSLMEASSRANRRARVAVEVAHTVIELNRETIRHSQLLREQARSIRADLVVQERKQLRLSQTAV